MNACDGCYYYRGTGGWKTCDYILYTGHRRPCPAGEGCTEKTLGKERYRMKAKWDTNAGFQMHQEGSSDAEIAEKLGISIPTVANYRRKHWEAPKEAEPEAPKQEITQPRGIEAVISAAISEAVFLLKQWEQERGGTAYLLEARKCIDALLKLGAADEL